MNVVVLQSPGDWCEVIVDGKQAYVGHESDCTPDVLLERLGVEYKYVYNADMIDGRHFSRMHPWDGPYEPHGTSHAHCQLCGERRLPNAEDELCPMIPVEAWAKR